MSNNNDTELPQASPGSTIEDKLNNILTRFADYKGKDESRWENCLTQGEAARAIQAIITTETTKARIDSVTSALQACPTKDHMLRLWLEQHLAALQKEQKQ